MKKWIIGVGLVLLVGVAYLLARQWAVETMVQDLLAEQIGADVEVDQVEHSWRTSTVTLSGLRIRNPEGFPGDSAVEIKTLRIRYKPRSLFSRHIVLPEVTLDVQRVVAVTDAQGRQNLQHLGRSQDIVDTAAPPPVTDQPAAAGADAPAPDAGAVTRRDDQPSQTPRTMQIDSLAFRLGEIEMRDYSRGGSEPMVRNYRLNLERTFSHVRDLDDVAQAVGMDLALTMAPQLIGDMLREADVSLPELEETIRNHDGDLEELGRALDAQTKDLQRELRRQLRAIREQSP